jgi:hypothetical protein
VLGGEVDPVARRAELRDESYTGFGESIADIDLERVQSW